jgi:hypothetical protein
MSKENPILPKITMQVIDDSQSRFASGWWAALFEISHSRPGHFTEDVSLVPQRGWSFPSSTPNVISAIVTDSQGNQRFTCSAEIDPHPPSGVTPSTSAIPVRIRAWYPQNTNVTLPLSIVILINC